MCDYGDVASLLGLDTPVQSPSADNGTSPEPSYDIESLLASLLEPPVTTPAASPEGDNWNSTKQFHQFSNYTFENSSYFTEMDQSTSCFTDQKDLLDVTSYPEIIPSSTSCPSDMFEQFDPAMLLSSLKHEPNAEICSPQQAVAVKPAEQYNNESQNNCQNVQQVYQNTDLSEIRVKEETLSIHQHLVEEPSKQNDPWNLEPPPPLFPSDIVDALDNVVALDTSETVESKKSLVVALSSQQAETQPMFQWTLEPQPTIQPANLELTVSPQPPPVDLSYQNLINAALRKRINSNQALPNSQSHTVIPVVSYSRDQLMVISEPVHPEPAQPVMSCAELFSSFLTPDEDPQPEDIIVVEEHPSEPECPKPPNGKRAFLEVYNQYVVNSNGTDQAFEVHEMYEVVNDVKDTQEVPTQPPRKRQRRINIDYGTDFQCVPCGKTFGKKGSLEQHVRSYHSEVRPWHCDTCGKNFATEEQLQRHVANHDDRNKKFQCSACEKRYVHWKDCERHYLARHGTPTFQCGQCQKAFVRRDHLLAHEVSHGRRHDREMRKEQQALRNGKRGGSKRADESVGL